MMTNLVKFAISALLGLLATRSCTAAPIPDPVHSMNKRVASFELNWPGLLGKNNIPIPEHVVRAYDYYKSQGDSLDEWHRNLMGLGGTSFWTTLHVLAKSDPDGWWIKRILETPDGDNVENKVIFKLHQYADGTWTNANQEVNVIDAEDENIPKWPIAIATAARQAGWQPQTPDASANDDAEKLLELLVGKQANTNFNIDSSNVIWEAAKDADTYPVLFFLESIGWLVVREPTQASRDDASKEEFKIGLFPFMDGEQYLDSQVVTATKFYQDFGPVIKKIVKMDQKLGTPADDRAAGSQ